MAEVDFIYKGNIINIQCNSNDKMKDIFQKFIIKAQINNNQLLYYLYQGYKINEDLTFEQLISSNDKEYNKIKILVNIINENDNKINSLIKSKYIICSKCKENIRFKIEDYKILLYECKNGHEINNILLDEYENTQYIDISKIKCEQCLIKNKSETYNNEFYRCCNCNKNLCPLCKSNHDKNHNIINYDIKNYICEKHNESFVEYCNDCKIDICLSCENEHINHNTTHYKNIMKDMNKIKNEMNEYKKEIDIFINDINDIINKLNKIK